MKVERRAASGGLVQAVDVSGDRTPDDAGPLESVERVMSGRVLAAGSPGVRAVGDAHGVLS